MLAAYECRTGVVTAQVGRREPFWARPLLPVGGGDGHGWQAAHGVWERQGLFQSGSPPDGRTPVRGGASGLRTRPGTTLLNGLPTLCTSGTPVSCLPLPARPPRSVPEIRDRLKPLSCVVTPAIPAGLRLLSRPPLRSGWEGAGARPEEARPSDRSPEIRASRARGDFAAGNTVAAQR